VDAEGLDVWCTSAEFIDIGAGDWEEHATLLCNFFLHLFSLQDRGSKKKAYIVWGTGIPEGDTVYCMTVDEAPPGEEPEVLLWNASKGSRFSAKDSRCTLKEVYCVADGTNVWGNIQQSREVRSTSFQLQDRRAWRPLFDAKNPSSSFLLDTVQEEIDWKPAQKVDAFVDETSKYIRVAVRNRLEHWRSRDGKSLVENDGANRKLTEILKKMEMSSHKEITFTEEDLHTEFSQYLQPGNPSSGFNMTGFYINRPFTDINPILEEIQNADIHHAGPVAGDSGDRDTQFAHAVYVKAFPRKVLSVWVAVACLSKKRG
jgi:coiled-coil and C2 domain-containing protein 2A